MKISYSTIPPRKRIHMVVRCKGMYIFIRPEKLYYHGGLTWIENGGGQSTLYRRLEV